MIISGSAAKYLERKVNELTCISTADFLKRNKDHLTTHKSVQDDSAELVMSHCFSIPLFGSLRPMVNKHNSCIDDIQRKVNSLMGIDDSMFGKYNK